ncbi:GGDEF domain-containing protein [Paenibacillus spiritus]|uniref:GGDEF domain-containing protein n=1 Tax=Paenibacillus spiritus TaxID=2496557 RepID=A0A5J5G815_9BACL|nr:sensor domain-containing diguanylate cyclase [Paenibacillus spiritus]KAA9003950.1 GGDEF domain-containing protein [Paenibacillus spiritus]
MNRLLSRVLGRRRVSLTTLLTLLVLVSTVFSSLILLAATYQSKKQSLINATLTINASNSEKMAFTMSRLFRSMEETLKSAASGIGREPADNEVIRRHLELARSSSGHFNSLVLINTEGVIQAAAPINLKAEGSKVPLLIQQTAAVQLLEPFVSRPLFSPLAERLIVYMSYPVYDKNGIYAGAVGGSIYLDQDNVLSLLFGAGRERDGSYSYVVGTEGELLFYPDNKRLGTSAGEGELIQRLKNLQSGQMKTLDPDGQEVLAGYSSVQANGWGIVVVSPMSLVYEQLNGSIRDELKSMILPYALLAAAVVWCARRLVRPLVLLANLVGRIGDEHLEVPGRRVHLIREADLLARALRVAIRNVRRQREELTHAAMTDPLTGLVNRRVMEASMEQWMDLQIPFSLIALDVDKFKDINDAYGHQTGDAVLQLVAGRMSSMVRPGDICCRYGGEEFVILLRGTGGTEAYEVAERIRRSIGESKDGQAVPVTVSQGIAEYPLHAETGDELFRQADAALYSAKDAGRNRTVRAGTDF